MRVLAITQIWPNRLEPLSSPFNRQQFRELSKLCELEVICAIASFPGAGLLGKPERTARLAALPDEDVIDGIRTHYMRQLYVPKYGVPVAVPLYVASLAPYARLAKNADVLLATWAYPDGCAAVLLGKTVLTPTVVKVHGTDMNYVAKLPKARAVMKRVLHRATALVSVSRPLSRELEDVGVPASKIELVPNGVDTSVFHPRDKGEARRALGLPEGAKVVLFVGRLEPQKGIGELLEAWDTVRAEVPGAVLALVGEGVSRPEVDAKVAASRGSIVAPGAQTLPEVARWLAACDVFTLPSWMEGTPNVVLEALASGRPTVGSDVGGIPDVLSDPRSGLVVPARDARALASALTSALRRTWDPEAARACGPGSWTDSARRLYDVLARAAAR